MRNVGHFTILAEIKQTTNNDAYRSAVMYRIKACMIGQNSRWGPQQEFYKGVKRELKEGKAAA